MGKAEFYRLVLESLRAQGYMVYGEEEIRGVGPSHRSRPDCFLVNSSEVVVGEIKSREEI